MSTAILKRCADLYLAGQDANSPLPSPLYAELRGFPPIYIQVGEYEILRDDSIRLVEKALASGIEVRLDVFPEMVYLFQLAVGNMPEADDAVGRIGMWVKKRLRLEDSPNNM